MLDPHFMLMLHTFFALMLFHFLLDYGIQGDFVAKFKAPNIDSQPNNIWRWVMFAHASAHTIPVYLITKSIPLSLFMLATHFAIDTLKCLGKLTFTQDQQLHLTVLAIIAVIFGLI